MSSTSIYIAEDEDICDLARIHVASKKAAYKNIVDATFLDAKTEQEYQEKWNRWRSEENLTVAVIAKNSEPQGFISFGKLQTPPPGTSKIRPLYSAEIYAIHVHPNYWRQGFGSRLITYAAQDLIKQKHQSLCLWVLQDNKSACAFYETKGGKRIGKRMVEVGPNTLKELCYGWRPILPLAA